MSKINKKNCTIIAEELLNSLTKKITGEDEEWLFGKRPSDCVMVGMIGGCKEESSIIKGEEVDDQRFESVPSIGIRFRFNTNYSRAWVRVKGKLFYRVKPFYTDQIKYMILYFRKKFGAEKVVDKESLINYIIDQKNNSICDEKIDIVKIYKSISLSDLGEIEIDLNDAAKSQDILDNELCIRLNKKIDEINKYSISCKNVLRSASFLLDEENFNNLLNSSISQVNIGWELRTYCSLTKYEKYSEFLLQLINYTNKPAPLSYEEQIFNGGLKIRGEVDFIPIEINSIKYNYIDRPNLPAIGNNCAVIKKGNNILETENIPFYKEHRVVTISQFNDKISFTNLIENPVFNLNFIYKKMKDRLSLYKAQLSQNFNKYFDIEIQDFEHEVNRFKRGIELIENREAVRTSFKLMNVTFSKNLKYNGWRLFQIVFIVSELPDLVNCEYEYTPGFWKNDIDNVDLIYFPTGGGKTETFLGCCIFSAFFDRIRGKNNGTTAIIKYPLRLLASQQLDRVLTLTINANIVKKKFNIGGDEFSVGFFTGSGNTPNKIDEKKKNDITDWDQATINENYRQIDVCPICHHEMNVFFDTDKWVLRHKCSSQICNFEPPIYIVDDEIYRKSPTFVISTIDKMANIGTSLGFRGLFGQTNNKCSKHGFSLGKKCSVPNCMCQIEEDVERKDPIPTLLIQDELHLVNESLGTFDSHYESLIQYYSEKLVSPNQRKKIKYIGATATIQNYESHIFGLYSKKATKFPTYIKKENFYSYIDDDDISRIIVGTALYGGSITESVQKIITLSRIIVSNWYDEIDDFYNVVLKKGFKGTKEDLKMVLFQYLIEIIYNNSKNDAGTIRAVLENLGNNVLQSEGIKNFDIAEITGDVEFKTIKSVMHDIEANENKQQTKNVIIATSAISHGVDEDCFNQIYFFGMSNQTAEYIQAYSRVGRAYTGLVFDIFRIVRDKDKSYLKNFYNYHEYKDILIDPVPINRYAKNAIYSTLPGIVAALMYQHYAKNYQSYSAMNVTKLIKDKILSKEKLIEDIENIYGCDQFESQLYKQIIDDEVEAIFDGFENNTSNDLKIADLIKRCNSKHKGPMTNLRDVEIGLEIELRGDR